MPSLKDSLAALIAQANAGEVDAPAQFVAYPGFFFPITDNALAVDGGPAAFDFVHRVNMIPVRAPSFMMNTNFVWNVYSDVLDHRVIATDDGAQHGYAKRFLDAEAVMGEGRMSPQENVYFSTNAIPANIDAPGLWSTHNLDGAAITSIAGTLSEADRQWLDRFNTLSALGDEMVASISFERAALLLLRPWFDPSLFEWRFWDLPGETISNGADPPSGRMPGYVSKLILIRNIRISLGAVALPDVGPEVMYRRLDGGPSPSAPSDALVDLGHDAEPPVMTASPLDAEAGAIDQQIGALQEKSALQLGLTVDGVPVGAQKFHVPIKFIVSAARIFAAEELARSEQRLIAASPPTGSPGNMTFTFNPDVALASLKLEVLKQKTSIFHKSWKKGLLKKAHMTKLGAAAAPDPNVDEERQEAERLVTRWRNSLSVLDQLEALPADPNPYVAILVCERIGMSPNPDPALFGQA